MAAASAIVLGGFRLRSDAKIVCYPDLYMDERGRAMWDHVWEIIAEAGGADELSEAIMAPTADPAPSLAAEEAA